MQFISCRVEKIEAGTDWRMRTLTLKLDSELVYPPNARAVLHYLEGGASCVWQGRSNSRKCWPLLKFFLKGNKKF
jgi:hypothetical protein